MNNPTLIASVPNRTITLSELEKHDEDHDKQWIAVEGFVIDITEYKDEHPGGADILEQNAGTDATQEFYNAGHSADAERKLMKLAIGRLEPSAVKKASSQSASSQSGSSKGTSGGVAPWIAMGLAVGMVGVIAYIFTTKKQQAKN